MCNHLPERSWLQVNIYDISDLQDKYLVGETLVWSITKDIYPVNGAIDAGLVADQPSGALPVTVECTLAYDSYKCNVM